jgi:hypothetical protein
LGGVETRQCVAQADHANLDEVIKFDVGRQLGDHLVRKTAHQGAVLLEQCAAVELSFGRVHGWWLSLGSGHSGQGGMPRHGRLPGRRSARQLCGVGLDRGCMPGLALLLQQGAEVGAIEAAASALHKALARATASLDRAIDVLLPDAVRHNTYDAFGTTTRFEHGGLQA